MPEKVATKPFDPVLDTGEPIEADFGQEVAEIPKSDGVPPPVGLTNPQRFVLGVVLGVAAPKIAEWLSDLLGDSGR